MSRLAWDKYGDRYTAMDRDLDEKRGKISQNCCAICNRRKPCRYHEANDG